MMQQQKQVKFGIIGLGTIAKRFAAVLQQASGAALYAVAARERSRAEAFAAEFGAKQAYGDYESLLQDAEVEVVYIATTHNCHYEITKQCLEHGKAVLCEKPAFLTKREAEELAALAKEKKLLLVEAMWTRMLPAYRTAKQWAESGSIGDVRYLDAQFSFAVPFSPESRLYDPEAAGGALYDAGVYPLEFATGLFGKPSEIQSMSLPAPTGVDAFDVMTMRFAGDRLATLVCGVNLRTSPDAGIYGTEGHIIVRNFVFGGGCELYDAEGKLVESYTETAPDGFLYEAEHVAELYRAGATESPLIPLQDTIDCAELFERLQAQWK